MRAGPNVAVLCDNESGAAGLGCEWGLAMAIRLADGALWLWDTGKSDLFLKNAALMGVEAAQAAGLALSHGHYDHTGGLAALLEAGFAGSIHAHPACPRQRWSADKDGPRRIGPPAPLPGFLPAEPTTRLAPGLTMLTDIPRREGNFQAVRGFSFDPAGTEPDAVPDDAFLVLETASGPVAVLGCCHSGLANSLECARERLGITSFHAVLGGLHLFEADRKAVEETAAALARFGVRLLAAGHCTGQRSAHALAELLPDCEATPLRSGGIFRFPA